jgi:hypothetical protein
MMRNPSGLWSPLVRKVSIGIILLLLLPAAASAGDWPEALQWGPYITGTTQTGTIVSCKVPAETSCRLEIWRDTSPDVTIVQPVPIFSDQSGQLQRFYLSGLSPATRYSYRLVVGNASTPVCHVSTFGDDDSDFIVYGDTRSQEPLFTQSERHRLVAERIAAEGAALVIHTGDFVTEGSDISAWDEFFSAARPMLANTTLVPVRGNHESNATLYSQIFAVEPYFSLNYGNSHIVVLDSTDEAWATMDEQVAWMQNDLEDTELAWTFAAFHHPLRNSDAGHWGGDEALREQWEPLFTRGGVIATFSAHTHAYERYTVNGTSYFVIGTGGAPCYTLSREKPAGFETALEYTLGYLRVHTGEKTATGEFVKVARVSEDNIAVSDVYSANETFDTTVLGGHGPEATPLAPAWAILAFAFVLLLSRPWR